MYDLIEVKTLNKKKVILALLVVLSIILLIVAYKTKGFGVLNKKSKVAEELPQQTQEQPENSIAQVEVKKTRHIAQLAMKPVFTEATFDKMKDLYHAEEKTVYLTFDDGPSKSVTPLILDLLKQENIKATFFVLGNRVERNPDLVKRAYEEGHYIANHGYSHNYASIYSSPQAVLDEYNQTQNAIKNALGTDYDGHLFRFPGGLPGGKYKNIKLEAKDLLAQNQICHIDWNALSQDAAGAKTKEALIQNVKDSVGSKQVVVILMHDAGDKILTYETLPEIIAYLREQGYSFKNFYEVMK